MNFRAGFLLLLAVCLTAIRARADEGPPLPEAPAKAPIEYYSEDAERGVISGSGEIDLRSGDFELRIDHGGVVLWVDFEKWQKFRATGLGGGLAAEGGGDGAAAAPADVIGDVIHMVYAEGGVYLRRDETEIRADRLFFDFVNNRAVVFDAEATTVLGNPAEGPRIPIVVRADRLYQVARDELHAHSARVTTCRWGEPHYELSVEHVVLRRKSDGDVTLSSEENVLRAAGIPIFWFPFSFASLKTGIEPIRDVYLGRSSRYGPLIGVRLGGGLRAGEDETEIGEWDGTVVYRSERGIGLGGGVEYDAAGAKGRLLGFYQRDRADEDHISGYEIPRNDRGRVRWQHRQDVMDDFLGGRLTGIGEFAWISDRGFLPEYYRREDREDKAQEDVLYGDWKRAEHAVALAGRWQANEFQTQTEYRPRLAYDLTNLTLSENFLGIGALSISGEAEAASVFRRHDHHSGLRGTSTDRTLARGAIHLPFPVGILEISPEVGGGVTAYSRHQDATRSEAFAAVRASTDLWRVWPDAKSKLLDLDGLRHVVTLEGAYLDRFQVSTPSRRLVVQDPEDLLDEVRAFEAVVRNRLETKRDGVVDTVVDLTLRGLFFPDRMPARPAPFGFREEWGLGMNSVLLPEEEKWRSIERQGMGPVTADLRMQVRPDLAFLGDAWYDFETHHFETWAAAVQYEAFPALGVYVGHRAIRGDSSILTGSVDFRITDRWNAQIFHQVDLRGDGALVTGLNLRRRYHDFLIGFEFRHNQHERETSFSVTVEPAFLFEAKRRPDDISVVDWTAPRWYR